MHYNTEKGGGECQAKSVTLYPIKMYFKNKAKYFSTVFQLQKINDTRWKSGFTERTQNGVK